MSAFHVFELTDLRRTLWSQPNRSEVLTSAATSKTETLRSQAWFLTQKCEEEKLCAFEVAFINPKAVISR